MTGPVLRHLAALLATDPQSPPLKAGEILTTDALTKVTPDARGEGILRWRSFEIAVAAALSAARIPCRRSDGA
jgi:hypothetical protein